MRLLAWSRDDLLTTVGVFVALVGLTVAAAFGAVVLSVVALVAGGTGFVLDALLLALLLCVLGGATAAGLSFLALCYGVCARVSVALRRHATRATRRAEGLERRNPLFRLVGLSDRLASLDPRSPRRRAEDRVDLLQHEYVSGALTEREFERRVGEVLAGAPIERRTASAIDERRRRVRDDVYRRPTMRGRESRRDARHRRREQDV